MELYKRHRPKALARIIGNESTVASLQNMLERNTLPHTIMFSGPSGCGKTTIARILKEELNCHDMDFKEINCSDSRGIDTIRDIANVMNLSPNNVNGCRIWLMDECHMLTKEAQNAALKILEDTPEHVYFFLCTTDPQKLIKTIQTRCCDMPVCLLTYDELDKLITRVCKREKITLSEDIKDDLISGAQGSARMALVFLDKMASLDEDQRSEALKMKMEEEIEGIELCRLLIDSANFKKIAEVLKNLKGEPESIRWSVLGYARSVLLKSRTYQAYLVIECFKNNFYDSKAAGLASACYEAVNTPEDK